MRSLPLALLTAFTLAAPAHAQRFEGIVVLGAAKLAVQKAQILLLGKRDAVLDSAETDVFGGFTVKTEKPGKYHLLVRRKGYLPVYTDNFELPEGEVLTDTVFLTGRQAEMSFKDALAESVRRVFGGSAITALSRMIGPDSIAVLRERTHTLADLIQSGRLLGVTLPAGMSSQCVRFTGQSYCGQLFVDEMPVFYRPDQVFLQDVEAVVAMRGSDLGSVVMDTRRYDNARYGVVMVYTNRFALR